MDDFVGYGFQEGFVEELMGWWVRMLFESLIGETECRDGAHGGGGWKWWLLLLVEVKLLLRRGLLDGRLGLELLLFDEKGRHGDYICRETVVK